MTALQFIVRLLTAVVTHPAVQDTVSAAVSAAARSATAQIVREVQNRTVKPGSIRTVR